MTETGKPLSLVVLISGQGSNFKAILDAIRAKQLSAVVEAVISSRTDAPGLDYARQANIDTLALEPADYPERDAYDRALQGLIDRFEPDMVVLAGFMRVLSADFVHHYRGRLINIHPSLLPALRGLDTHQRALNEGLKEHGASVHFVTEELDSGPVIIQVRVPVLPDDDADSLAARVLQQEHRLYVKALHLLAGHQVRWDGTRLLYNGKPLQQPIELDAEL